MERDYIRLNYWTSDRSLVVDYVFWDLGERGWRIYIISHIDYQGRDCSSHAAHWLQDNDSSYPYICWNGNIATLEQAKASHHSGRNVLLDIFVVARVLMILPTS